MRFEVLKMTENAKRQWREIGIGIIISAAFQLVFLYCGWLRWMI